MIDFLSWAKGVLNKMLNRSEIKGALGVDVAESGQMQEAIKLWAAMLQDQAPWLDDTTKSLGLAASIAGELSRLTLVELDAHITGTGDRAEFLDKALQRVLSDLPEALGSGLASGSIVFKPYVTRSGIAVELIPAWKWFPTAFNSRREVTAAVFPERETHGKTYYTRLEYHALTADGYTVRNMAFMSQNESSLGRPCNLDAVPEWAELEPEITFGFKDKQLDKMLFAQFRVPWANHVDPESPLGVSVFSRAVSLIQEADRQYSRILWEFEGSELAVDASETAIRPDSGMPKRKQRLFRKLNFDAGDGGDLYKVFSPAIRDHSLFNGLNQILRRIEFNCNLAYGTISDPADVDKTAEEIKGSKQRSYSAVCELQKALNNTIEHLVWIMDFYTTLYRLAPSGAYEITTTWGDGVLEDADKEFARRKMLVDAGLLKPEKLLGWYFGISEEEALDYMPDGQPIGFGE